MSLINLNLSLGELELQQDRYLGINLQPQAEVDFSETQPKVVEASSEVELSTSNNLLVPYSPRTTICLLNLQMLTKTSLLRKERMKTMEETMRNQMGATRTTTRVQLLY